MAIVDEQGRLFGRLNLLDAVLLVLLAGLVPLGYAAYLLFREQPPRLTGVVPARVEVSDETRLIIRGENLRPYMRVSAGNHQALEFLFKSPREAEVPFTKLPVGEYDIVLYDHAQERVRLPKALTVVPGPMPKTQVVVAGIFGNLDADKAKAIVPGLKLDDGGEVIRVGTPGRDFTRVFAGSALVGVMVPNALQVPAQVRLSCTIRSSQGRPDCVLRDAAVAPNVLVMLNTPIGQVPFQIDHVIGSAPLQQRNIEVRVTAHPSVISLMKPGDADRGGTSNPVAAGAVITRIGPIRRTSDSTAEADVTLRADLQEAGGGWLYDSAPVRAGMQFPIRTPAYVVYGTVISIPATGTSGANE